MASCKLEVLFAGMSLGLDEHTKTILEALEGITTFVLFIFFTAKPTFTSWANETIKICSNKGLNLRPGVNFSLGFLALTRR